MTRLFITATGTDIGKTFVTAALAHQAHLMGRSVRVMKPVTSGFDEADPSGSDTAILLEATGVKPQAERIEEVSPWRFKAPIAPHMAAAKEGREVPYGPLVDYCRDTMRGPFEVVLIEGVGGVMAPLDPVHTVLDWIVALNIPALLVAGSYVGTISHTLSALGALRAAGVRVPAIVLSETPGSLVTPREQAAAIAGFSGGVPVHTIAWQEGQRPWATAPCPHLCSVMLGRACK